MNTVVHYFQSCPVCGRALRIRVSLLGKHVYCQHCGGGFRATDPATRAAPVVQPHHAAVAAMAPACGNGDGHHAAPPCEDDLLHRVEVVLQRAEQVRAGAAMVTARVAGHGAAGCAGCTVDAHRDASSVGR
ncbi:MAG: hypothetical protein ACOYK7_02030 [Pirellulales bacterium]